jgi:hypothetical protein
MLLSGIPAARRVLKRALARIIPSGCLRSPGTVYYFSEDLLVNHTDNLFSPNISSIGSPGGDLRPFRKIF